MVISFVPGEYLGRITYHLVDKKLIQEQGI